MQCNECYLLQINQIKPKKDKAENGYEVVLNHKKRVFLNSKFLAAKYKLILDRFKENG